jgi:tRNA1Val (adenine37-N6)-methyltransferase
MTLAVTELDVSEDALFGGRVKLLQPAPGAGYRVNVDALLLGAFAAGAGKEVELAVDLGSGVGAVGLTLFHLGVARRVEFIEKDPVLAELCARNLAANRFAAKGTVHVGNLEGSLEGIAPSLLHAANLVVANPPYVAPERDGRVARSSQIVARLAARRGSVAPFMRTAAAALGRRGRVCVVYPAHALLDLMMLSRALGLEPKRLRLVHAKPKRPARVALVQLSTGKTGGLTVVPPLVEMSEDGRRTPEVIELLGSKSIDAE